MDHALRHGAVGHVGLGKPTRKTPHALAHVLLWASHHSIYARNVALKMGWFGNIPLEGQVLCWINESYTCIWYSFLYASSREDELTKYLVLPRQPTSTHHRLKVWRAPIPSFAKARLKLIEYNPRKWDWCMEPYCGHSQLYIPFWALDHIINIVFTSTSITSCHNLW